MENKNEILSQLAQIRDAGVYSEADIEFIETQLDHEDDAVRAAAILVTEGCLYNMMIVDKILEIARNDASLPVRKAAIKMLGTFVTACVLEGFETPTHEDKGLEYQEEFDELLEKGIEEKYEEVKAYLFEELQIRDLSDDLIPDILSALSELAFRPDIREKITQAWQFGDDDYRQKLIPAMERYPESFEDLILDGLVQIKDEKTTLQLLELAQDVPTQRMADMVQTFLDSPHSEIVSRALLTLAQINKTEGLQDILQRFCLHEDEHVQIAARKALDIFSHKNFDDFMNQYF
jgi:hypothetical protein